MSFSENLKKIRIERQLTQAALAERISVSHQAISKWESGNGFPETSTLILMAKELNVSLDYLFFGSLERTTYPSSEQPDISANSFRCPYVNTAPATDPQSILRAVCNRATRSEASITNLNHRGKDEQLLQHIIMYLCKEYSHMSLTEIASFIGRKDHTTILHCISRVKKLLQTDEAVQLFVENVKKDLRISDKPDTLFEQKHPEGKA